MIGDLEDTVRGLKKSLRARLAERASAGLIQRLEAHLDRAADGSASLAQSLKGIRTTVRLLIDEQLAEELHDHLVFAGIASGHLRRDELS
jgi:hypothetical protein